jgi:uncharacterized protein YndB with AHSA1/START domain
VTTDTYETTLFIEAAPDRVFDHFVQPELLVRWMGDFARLQAVSGGVFSVDINGVLIRGTFLTVDRPNLIEIAWGEAGNEAMPPGSTRLRISLEAAPSGTALLLQHSLPRPAEAEKHAVGWQHFLGRLSILAAGGDPGADPWRKSPPELRATGSP